MADVMPKISDIKNLKDLSKVIVLPLLCACYLLQSDFNIHVGDFLFMVSKNATLNIQITQVVIVFTCKALWAAIISISAYLAVIYANIFIHRLILPTIVLLLLTLGFSGIFSPEKIPLLLNLGSVWFYASFVVAFFLLAMQDEIDNVGLI
ncbi:hypothetical protein [Neptunicella marina]|uniref:Uncharacterized protein n=1 Tax=Neptunicella marina TaxID=2125989 RepID=A0A8J6IUM5_9ALTE|nr:hypothetical protein [Neptunicella marina]MBC3767680.1 hypothetical protein [Neptunicella marina]